MPAKSQEQDCDPSETAAADLDIRSILLEQNILRDAKPNFEILKEMMRNYPTVLPSLDRQLAQIPDSAVRERCLRSAAGGNTDRWVDLLTTEFPGLSRMAIRWIAMIRDTDMMYDVARRLESRVKTKQQSMSNAKRPRSVSPDIEAQEKSTSETSQAGQRSKQLQTTDTKILRILEDRTRRQEPLKSLNARMTLNYAEGKPRSFSISGEANWGIESTDTEKEREQKCQLWALVSHKMSSNKRLKQDLGFNSLLQLLSNEDNWEDAAKEEKGSADADLK